MTDGSIWARLDRLIKDCSSTIDLLAHVTPTSESFEREKQRFLNGETDEPDFDYDDLQYDPERMEQRLEAVEVPDGPVGDLYQRTIQELKAKNELVRHRGEPGTVRDRAREIYGEPSDELLDHARRLLEDHEPDDHERTPVSAEDARETFESALERMELTDWETRYTDTTTVSVSPADKTINVPEDRDFGTIEPIRLAVHEMLHAVRSANGYAQDYEIFGIGIAGYQDTEEGLATFLEEATGYQDRREMRKYAARVIVTNNVQEGKSFDETFQELHEDYRIDEDRAFQYTARGYRGGGFAKDHIYLQGYREVKDYVEQGGDLRKLLRGKIPLEDVTTGKLDNIDGLHEPVYDHLALDQGLEPLFTGEGDAQD